MRWKKKSGRNWGRLGLASKLNDICSYAKGKTAVAGLTTQNYISTENMLPNKGGITTATNLPSVDQTQAYRKNDVLVSNIRPYFKKIWHAEYDGGCSNDVLVFRAAEGVDPIFLYYVLADDTFFNYATATSKGTKMPRGDKSAIMEYGVPTLDIEAQRKIGALLRSIDQKIAINSKINDNLQQQASALFAQYYEQASDTVPFTSVIQILGGGTPKTGDPLFWNGNVPFFTPKDVGAPYTLTTEKTITEDGLDHCNSRIYPVNTVFVTARGTVGKVGMPGVPMAMNQSCYALVGKDIDQLMVYFYTLQTVQALKHKASGAVFDAITTRDFETETIRLIADDAAAEFLSVATPMFGQILGNSIENQRLAELRDALLPRLMAGEIDVSGIDLSC